MSHHHSPDHSHGHSHQHSHSHSEAHSHEHENINELEHSHEHTHSHSHSHAHEASHNHLHESSSVHCEDVVSSLSFEEKLIKLLTHWIKHNDDHAGTYIDWAKRAEAAKLPVVNGLLRETADMTRLISEKFDAALKELQKE